MEIKGYVAKLIFSFFIMAIILYAVVNLFLGNEITHDIIIEIFQDSVRKIKLLF